MADYYVKSPGFGLLDGSNWDNAFATILAATSNVALLAGDTIYVSNNHNVASASSNTHAMPLSGQIVTKILCVDDSSFPPVALAATAQENSANGTTRSWTGGAVYMHGVSIKLGTSGNANQLFTLQSVGANIASTFKSCSFIFGASGSTNGILSKSGNATSGGRAIFEDCTFSIGHSNACSVLTLGLHTVVRGGFVIAPSIPTTRAAFAAYQVGRTSYAEIEGVDLTACPSTLNLFSIGGGVVVARMSGCKLPANWTGDYVIGAPSVGSRISAYNCDSGAEPYRIRITAFEGTIRDEATIVRTNGGTHGTTPISWKMVASADASHLGATLESDPIAVLNAVVGSPITATVEVLANNYTFTDEDCWLEASYSASGANSLTAVGGNRRAIGEPVAHPSSTVEWAAGLATPIRQKLSVTFTPQQAGVVYVTVKQGKAGSTLYVDPLVSVS